MVYKDVKVDYLSRDNLVNVVTSKELINITDKKLDTMSKVDLLKVLKKNDIKTARVNVRY